jgi:hypothetical protein
MAVAMLDGIPCKIKKKWYVTLCHFSAYWRKKILLSRHVCHIEKKNSSAISKTLCHILKLFAETPSLFK